MWKWCCVLLIIQKIGAALPCMTCSQIVPFSNYSYFYLNDKSSSNPGSAHGQNVVVGFNSIFSPCFFTSLYGNYQQSTQKSPSSGGELDVGGGTIIPGTPSLNTTSGEGWGVGGSANYLMSPVCYPCQAWAYGNVQYVWARQSSTSTPTIPTSDSASPLNTRGQNWLLVGGVNLLAPTRCVNIWGNINYLYAKNHTNGGSSTVIAEGFQTFDETVSTSGSILGVTSATSTLVFFPCSLFNPLVIGGVSYDTLRKNSIPTQVATSGTDPIGTSSGSAPNRARFEWNVGAGLAIKKEQITFTASYLHRQRAGPIMMDTLSIYGSYTF